MISVPQVPALAVSALTFVAMYAFANWALPSVEPHIGLPLFLLGFLFSGGVVGYLAGQSPLMHGSILGLLTGTLAISYVAARDGFLGGIGSLLMAAGPALVAMAIPGIILCSLGALLGDYIRSRVGGL